MKKILFAIAFVLTMSFCANAQRNDGFFKVNDVEEFDYRNGAGAGNEYGFSLPAAHGYDYDTNAPLGTGLLILTALGAGYMARKSKRQQP